MGLAGLGLLAGDCAIVIATNGGVGSPSLSRLVFQVSGSGTFALLPERDEGVRASAISNWSDAAGSGSFCGRTGLADAAPIVPTVIQAPTPKVSN